MANSDSTAATDRRLLLLSSKDNVFVVASPIAAGESLRLEGAVARAAVEIPMGHKVARRAIAAKERIIKYGAPIGSATRAIAAGEHVHIQNMKSDYLPTFLREGAKSYVLLRSEP